MEPLVQDTSTEQTYTSYESLEPVQPTPETYEGQLKSLDWKVQFATLTALRQLCKHQSDLFFQLSPSLLPLIASLSDSIRSNLSKNALLLLTEMFLEPHPAHAELAEALVPGLLQKTISEKSFIRQQATAALRNLCRVAGSPIIMQQLGSFCWHKSGVICDNAFEYLKIVYETGNIRDVFASVTGLLNSKRKKIESGARNTLRNLQGHPEFAGLVETLEEGVKAEVQRALASRPLAGQNKDIRSFIEERKKALQENN